MAIVIKSVGVHIFKSATFVHIPHPTPWWSTCRMVVGASCQKCRLSNVKALFPLKPGPGFEIPWICRAAVDGRQLGCPFVVASTGKLNLRS